MQMKEALFLVLFLVPLCSTMKRVYIDDSVYTLNTNSGDNYFYMDLFYATIFDLYFYLDDSSYGLTLPIEYCVTDSYPGNSDSFSCNYKTLYTSRTSGSLKYFKVTSYYLSAYRYIVLKYTGSNPGGYLYAKASYDDIFDIVGTTLSIVSIVCIVIGCIVFVSILITILCCVFRRRRIYGGVGYVPPQPAVVITTPLNPY
jgi:hypothetical protein